MLTQYTGDLSISFQMRTFLYVIFVTNFSSKLISSPLKFKFTKSQSWKFVLRRTVGVGSRHIIGFELGGRTILQRGDHWLGCFSSIPKWGTHQSWILSWIFIFYKINAEIFREKHTWPLLISLLFFSIKI